MFLCSVILLNGQSPFRAVNSQMIEWNDPTYYQLSSKGSSLGILYQSQYENQQANIFKSYSFFGQHLFRLNKKDVVGVQLSAFQDQDQNTLRSVQLKLGGSYQKTFTDARSNWQHQAGVGFQVGISRLAINFDNFWFSSQFDVGSESIDFGLLSGENIPIGEVSSSGYFPFHGGINYRVSNGKTALTGVFSVQNINRPQTNFDGFSQIFEMGYFGHLEFENYWLDQLKWRPWISYGIQGQSELIQLGSAWSFESNEQEDWQMTLSGFGYWSPRLDEYKLTQIGVSFEVAWNEFGFLLRYLFPIRTLDNLGNTFQVGVFFLPKLTN